MLGYPAELARDDVGLADRVEELGLSVVYMAHDRDDRGAMDQVLGLVGGLLYDGLVVERDDMHGAAVLLGEYGRRVRVDLLVDRRHDAEGHELRDELGRLDVHLLGELRDGDVLHDVDLLGDRHRSGFGLLLELQGLLGLVLALVERGLAPGQRLARRGLAGKGRRSGARAASSTGAAASRTAVTARTPRASVTAGALGPVAAGTRATVTATALVSAGTLAAGRAAIPALVSAGTLAAIAAARYAGPRNRRRWGPALGSRDAVRRSRPGLGSRDAANCLDTRLGPGSRDEANCLDTRRRDEALDPTRGRMTDPTKGTENRRIRPDAGWKESRPARRSYPSRCPSGRELAGRRTRAAVPACLPLREERRGATIPAAALPLGGPPRAPSRRGGPRPAAIRPPGGPRRAPSRREVLPPSGFPALAFASDRLPAARISLQPEPRLLRDARRRELGAS